MSVNVCANARGTVGMVSMGGTWSDLGQAASHLQQAAALPVSSSSRDVAAPSLANESNALACVPERGAPLHRRACAHCKCPF